MHGDWVGEISIHAPQWGATRRRPAHVPYCRDFNPRTPVGCDTPQHSCSWMPRYFNPRTPVGCDAQFTHGVLLHIISIHAPQWGATSNQLAQNMADIFQSTHPSGVRLTQNVTGFTLSPFQSTHPSGVRPRWRRHFIRLIQISIHAPQWGATVRHGKTPC